MFFLHRVMVHFFAGQMLFLWPNQQRKKTLKRSQNIDYNQGKLPTGFILLDPLAREGDVEPLEAGSQTPAR